MFFATLHKRLLVVVTISTSFEVGVSIQSNIAPTELCQWRKRRLWGEVHDENAAGLGGISSHAGLFGTAEDVCKLGHLYLTENALLSKDITTKAVSEHVRASDGTRRGLGWMLKSSNSTFATSFSSDSFGHTGYTGTSLWCDPKTNITISLLTNRVYSGRNPEPIIAFRRMIHDEIARVVNKVVQ